MQVVEVSTRPVAVFDAVKAVQVRSRFHPADHKKGRDAISGVGHGNVLNDLCALGSQNIACTQCCLPDFLRQVLVDDLTCARVRKGNAHIIRGKANAHTPDAMINAGQVIRHWQVGSRAVAWVTPGHR